MAAEFSVVVLGMLLFSERTWKHHCVTLLLPFAVLSYTLVVLWSRKGLRTYLIASLAAVVLLMSSTSISLLGRDAGKLAQVYGAYVVAFFLLLAAFARPAHGALDGEALFLGGRVVRWAFIENHCDVRAKNSLDAHGLLWPQKEQ